MSLWQACLAVAFIVEGLLFAFHLEGTQLNWQMHLLLVFCIMGAAGASLAEMRFRASFLLSTLRALLVLLQGAWFCTIAHVLFEGAAQYRWHPDCESTASKCAVCGRWSEECLQCHRLHYQPCVYEHLLTLCHWPVQLRVASMDQGECQASAVSIEP